MISSLYGLPAQQLCSKDVVIVLKRAVFTVSQKVEEVLKPDVLGLDGEEDLELLLEADGEGDADDDTEPEYGAQDAGASTPLKSYEVVGRTEVQISGRIKLTRFDASCERSGAIEHFLHKHLCGLSSKTGHGGLHG